MKNTGRTVLSSLASQAWNKRFILQVRIERYKIGGVL